MKITQIEKKRTTTGKDKADVVLDGATKATIWGDFPKYADLAIGMEVEGELIPSKDPKYAPTLSPLKKTTQWGMSKPYAKGGVSQAERDKSIEKAQDRKAESIAYFNSVNSAISIVGKLMEYDKEKEWGGEDVKFGIKEWRDWFINEYDTWNNQPF